ncbi:MAG TPA: phosphopyruvate hydratase [Terriglobales bacterium]|nr:phosphopyruvate hydratase [Terriglobales bacterium]
MKIRDIDAFQIFDSRGNPTIEAVVTLDSGVRGHGLVPSGASTGRHEALELRDGDPTRFRGRSVFRAVEHIRQEIAAALVGWDVTDQVGLDRRLNELDGTPNKSRLGANAVLSVSMAAARAAAAGQGRSLFDYLGIGTGTLLPLPEIQLFGGGKHANGRVDVQDFMIVATGATTFEQTLEMTFNVFHSAGDLLKERGLLAGVADEGGYWPVFDRNEAVFEAMLEGIVRAGYEPGRQVAISLDIAASELFRDGHYHLGLERRSLSSTAFAELLASWVDKYPILSIEDPMAEEDWEGWARVRKLLGHRIQLIGDDLFTTHLGRIQKGIASGVANAVLIKLNQIGTLTETVEAIRATQRAGWLPVISARSGETEDAFIAHLAVATDAGQIKVGSFCRSERMAKWNELLRIQRELGARARFLGSRIYQQILPAPK